MHQSGHSRAHSMQTVQFSSSSPMTPRLRGGRSGRWCGYSWVTDGCVIDFNVTPSPCASPFPGTFTSASSPAAQKWTGFAGSSRRPPYDAGEGDLRERGGDETGPRELLQLVGAQPRVADPDPDHHEGQQQRLEKQPEPTQLVLQERPLPPAEEQRRGQCR